MADGAFTINLDETFPRLSRPPVVEAVIHWQARAQKPMEPDCLRAALADKLPMYPQCSPIHGFGLMAKLSVADGPVVEHQNQGYVGFRLTSEDGCYMRMVAISCKFCEMDWSSVERNRTCNGSHSYRQRNRRGKSSRKSLRRSRFRGSAFGLLAISPQRPLRRLVSSCPNRRHAQRTCR